MRTRTRLIGVLTGVALLTLAVSETQAQGLAEVARKEAARRDAVAASGKTYTNSNLTPDFTTPQPVPVPAPAGNTTVGSAETPKEGAEAAAGAAPADAAPADQDGVTPRDQQQPQPEDDKNEAFWRNQSQLVRSRLANQNAQILQLRTRLASFSPGSQDTEQRVVEKTLEKATSDLTFLNEEWVRFERQARERKIPESWIR